MDTYGPGTCIRPKELAQMIGVRPQMIFNYISAGRIPAYRCDDHNGQWCINSWDVEAFIQARTDKEQAKYDKIQRQLEGLE